MAITWKDLSPQAHFTVNEQDYIANQTGAWEIIGSLQCGVAAKKFQLQPLEIMITANSQSTTSQGTSSAKEEFGMAWLNILCI